MSHPRVLLLGFLFFDKQPLGAMTPGVLEEDVSFVPVHFAEDDDVVGIRLNAILVKCRFATKAIRGQRIVRGKIER